MRILGKEHPMPGLGVLAGRLGKVRHGGLRLRVGKRAGDKILLHIHHNVKNHFIIHHDLLLHSLLPLLYRKRADFAIRL